MIKAKTCWFCKEATMVEKGDYLQCLKCGATFSELPKPGGYPMVKEYIPLKVRRPGSTPRQYRPRKQRGK
jgi:hypothetical protein